MQYQPIDNVPRRPAFGDHRVAEGMKDCVILQFMVEIIKDLEGRAGQGAEMRVVVPVSR